MGKAQRARHRMMGTAWRPLLILPFSVAVKNKTIRE